MKSKQIIAFLSCFLLIAGCASTSPEPPKPTPAKAASNKNTAKKAVNPNPQSAPQAANKPNHSGNNTATYALDNGPGNFKVEPTTQSMRVEPIIQPGTLPQAASQAALTQPGTGVPSIAAMAPAMPPQTASPVLPMAAAPVAEKPLSIKLEDAGIPAGTSPAVVALISEAERNSSHGDLDAAVVVTERALRIDSRNPTITYKLAQLRLKQSKPQQAEELAGKAALLAGSNLDLKRKSWLLIAEARQLQRNYQGAKEAKAKAESFFGR